MVIEKAANGRPFRRSNFLIHLNASVLDNLAGVLQNWARILENLARVLENWARILENLARVLENRAGALHYRARRPRMVFSRDVGLLGRLQGADQALLLD
jgi:hypothetical protein